MHKAVHHMSATVKDRLRRCSGTRSATVRNVQGIHRRHHESLQINLPNQLASASFAGYSFARDALLWLSNAVLLPAVPMRTSAAGGYELEKFK